MTERTKFRGQRILKSPSEAMMALNSAKKCIQDAWQCEDTIDKALSSDKHAIVLSALQTSQLQLEACAHHAAEMTRWSETFEIDPATRKSIVTPELAEEMDDVCRKLGLVQKRLKAGAKHLEGLIPELEERAKRENLELKDFQKRQDAFVQRLQDEYQELAERLADILQEREDLDRALETYRSRSDKHLQNIAQKLGRRDHNFIGWRAIIPGLKASGELGNIWPRANRDPATQAIANGLAQSQALLNQHSNRTNGA